MTTLPEIAARLQGYNPDDLDVASAGRFLRALVPAPE